MKNVVTAYLLWACLGAHYAYVGKWGVQIFFWLSLGGLLVWWAIDVFRIPSMVRKANARHERWIQTYRK